MYLICHNSKKKKIIVSAESVRGYLCYRSYGYWKTIEPIMKAFFKLNRKPI